VPLLCDNKSAVKLTNNPVQHARTKHIDVRHHFIRDHQQKRDICIGSVGTDDQLTDIFIKPLDLYYNGTIKTILGTLRKMSPAEEPNHCAPKQLYPENRLH
jgi:hypothetical protein